MRRNPATDRMNVVPPTRVSFTAKRRVEHLRIESPGEKKRYSRSFRNEHAPYTFRDATRAAPVASIVASRVLEKPRTEPMKIHVRDRTRNQHGERSRIIVVSQRPVHRAYARARRSRLSRDSADEGQGQPRHDDDRRRAHREPSHRSPRPLLGRIPTRGGARAREEVGRSRLGARRWIRHGDCGVDAPRASVVARGGCRPPRGRRRAPTSAEFGVRVANVFVRDMTTYVLKLQLVLTKSYLYTYYRRNPRRDETTTRRPRERVVS